MEHFAKAYGEPITAARVPEAVLRKYSHLPAGLLGEWRQHGFAVYRQGLLWFTNPDGFTDAVEGLLGKRRPYRCVARTAFGDLILFEKDDRWAFYSAYTLDLTAYTGSYDLIFDFMMSDNAWLRDVMRLKLYQKALKRLGPLEADEVYAFEPHPALGGSGEASTIQRRKLLEYLDFLGQLATEKSRD